MITFIMKKWNIYYHKLAKPEIEELPIKLLARYYALTKRMVDRGPNLGEPHTKAMGDGLFEIRIKGESGIARVFYCTESGNEIWILRSFIKKTPKTPIKELSIDRTRLKEIRNEKR